MRDFHGKDVQKGQEVRIDLGTDPNHGGIAYGKVIALCDTSIELSTGVWVPVSRIAHIEVLQEAA